MLADPSAIAIASDATTLTRGAVAEAARGLAERLWSGGVGVENVVAIDCDRPSDVIIGVLGILEAGAAFMVIAPGLHPATVAARLRQTGAVATVASGDEPARLVVLLPPAATDPPPHGLLTTSQLAYVIFTSGSTGSPKGVMIERGSLTTFCASIADRLQLASKDVWLQVASPGFDVYVEEILPVLMNGGVVRCRPSFSQLGPSDLHRALEAGRCTIVELSTQYWYEYQRWLESVDRRPPDDLRAILVGGERMDPDAYRRWQARFHTPLVHVYGLTECSVTSTTFHGRLSPGAGDVPLGTALEGCEVTVGPHDATGRGEVVVCGPMVGRGYVGDPAATAARFVPDPFGPPGERMYLTGDVGGVDGGVLVFHGRRDSDIKVRGHRVDPSDVERQLERSSEIDRAAVVPDPRIPTSLAAVLVMRESFGSGAGVVAISHETRQRIVDLVQDVLATWEIPGRCFRASALPLNDHGKLDRVAVAAMIRSAGHESSGDGDEPRGLVAQAVLGAFRRILGDDMTSTSDFFEFGGNSLVAMRLVEEINDELAADILRPAMLYDARTPKQLWRLAEHRRALGTPGEGRGTSR